jgi:hypothetical protein
MTGSVVLIFSTDPLAAALLGAGVELARATPAFPRDQESAREALLRVKPRLVMIDCDHEEACSEALFGPAMMIGARISVFSSTRSRRVLEPIAREFNVATFDLPIDFDELARLLHECGIT